MPDTALHSQVQHALKKLGNGRYQLTEELGRGGMATVFACQDTKLKRTVAVKVLHPHLLDDLKYRSRFRREAESIARLDHPHIVDVYDILEIEDEFLAIVMEYVDGPSLAELIEQSAPVPPELAIELLLPILDGLGAAHELGIIHRDIKPANILIDAEGQPRLSDFGIAHVTGDTTLTKTGSVIGSPAFMAPEMADGGPIDQRIDLFSLGAILFLMVTASMPFAGESAPTLLRNISEGRRDRADLVHGPVGRDFADLIEEIMSTDRDERPESARIIADRLQRFLQTSMDQERPDLMRWIKDLEGYPSKLERQISDHLLRRAGDAVEQNDTHCALPLLERLIAIDPSHSEAINLLDHLHRDGLKRRVLYGAVTLTALLGIAGLAYIGFHPASDDEPSENRTAEPREVDTATESELAVTDILAGHAHSLSALQARYRGHEIEKASSKLTLEIGQGADEDNRDEIAPPDSIEPMVHPEEVEQFPTDDAEISPPETESIRFRLIPASATLRVDELELDAMDAARGIALPHGEHRIVTQGPGAQPKEQSLLVNADTETERTIVLNWKDGYIRLLVDRDALVWLDDKATPTAVEAGQEKLMTVPFGRADQVSNEQEIGIRIAPRDDLERSREEIVRVRPETETPVAVTLNEDR